MVEPSVPPDGMPDPEGAKVVGGANGDEADAAGTNLGDGAFRGGGEGHLREAVARVDADERQDKDKAKAWFEKIGVEGVVAMRLVSADTVNPTARQCGALATTPAWGYYGYTWGAVWDPGYLREDTVVTGETLVFSVPRDQLLWAALSETTNPKSMDAFMKDLVTKAVKEMTKAGLTAKSRK